MLKNALFHNITQTNLFLMGIWSNRIIHSKSIIMRRRVKLGLYGLSVADIIQFCRNVVSSMTGNANYPAPVPDLADVTTAVDELETAHENTLNGGKKQTTIQREKRTKVFNLMRTERDHVNVVGDGDAVVLESSGFPLADIPGSIVLAQPENLRTRTLTKPGSVEVLCNTVEGALNYQVQYQKEDPLAPGILVDKWTILDPIGPKRQTVTGLDSVAYYWFQMRATGSGKPSPWSDPARGLVA